MESDDPDALRREIDALRKERETDRARTAFAARVSGAGVLEWRADTGLFLSPNLEAMLGVKTTTLGGIRRLVHPGDWGRALRTAAKVLRSGDPQVLEARVGRTWYRVVFEPDRAGNRTVGVLGFVQNIHEAKLAELALRNSERLFRALFDGTTAAVTLRDVETREMIDCNDAALRLYGCKTRAELTARTIIDLSAGDAASLTELLSKHVDEVMTRGEARREWPSRRVTGEPFPADVHTSLITLDGGRQVMQTIVLDVTPRKEAEMVLRRRAEAETLVGLVSSLVVHGDLAAARAAAEKGVAEIANPIIAKQLDELLAVASARLAAEEALQRSEARYRMVLDASRDAIMIMEVDGRMSFASPSVEDMLGYPPSDWTGHARFGRTIATPESLATLDDNFHRLTSGKGVPERTEITWIHKNGSTVVTENAYAPVTDASGRLVALQIVARDVTERRRAADSALRRTVRDRLLSDISRLMLRSDEAGVSSALERIGTTLDAGRVSLFEAVSGSLRCTEEWSRAGFTVRSPFAGRTVPDGVFSSVDENATFEPAVREAWFRDLERLTSSEKVFAIGTGDRTFALIALRPDEPEKWREDDSETVRKAGELIAIGRVRRAASVALTDAKEEAVHASRAKSAFLANMSHELRTPLNGVIGMVDLLARTPLDAKQKRYTEVARSSAKLLLSIIDDILDFSKIEAGKLDLEHAEFSVAEVVNDVLRSLAYAAEAKAIDLRSDLDPDVAHTVLGDGTRLRQVVVNLVNNAIKFTRRGSVIVRARVVSDSRMHLVVRIEVVDSGIGIAPEAMHKLFTPFSQVDASHRREHGGTGLGLAICREIVERMGGQISVESEPDRGSTFAFVVGFEMSDAPMVPSTHTGEIEAVLSDARILLVEDSPINAEVAREILAVGGYSCDLVVDGVAAVEAAQQTEYRLVLMDCQLPGFDGYEATARIRELEKKAGRTAVPIIALTANAAKDDVERCLACGMNDYVVKPVDARRLLELVRLHVGEHPAVAHPERTVQRLMGNRALLKRLVTTFISEAPTARDRTAAALDRRDERALAYEAHRFRGQAAALDADDLAKVLADLERASLEHRWDSAQNAMRQMDAELARVVAALGRLLLEP